jgi:hypothetical protein
LGNAVCTSNSEKALPPSTVHGGLKGTSTLVPSKSIFITGAISALTVLLWMGLTATVSLVNGFVQESMNSPVFGSL